MNGMRKMWSVCRLEFSKWKKAYRLYMIGVLLFLFFYQYTGQLFLFAKEKQYPVTPWLLPFLLSSKNARWAIYFCAILFFSNLFSEQKVEKYVIVRCGRKAYLGGKMLYVLCASAVYTLLIALLPVLQHLDCIYIGAEWGKIFGAWSRMTSLHTKAGIHISETILKNLSCGEAMVMSFFLLWLTTSVIGTTVFFFNSVSGNAYGVMAGGVLVGMDMLSCFIPMQKDQAMFLYISPVSCSNLDLLLYRTELLQKELPGMAYAFALNVGLLILYAVMAFVLMRATYRSGSKVQLFHAAGV